MIYRANRDKTQVSFSTEILHEVDFHNQRPKDERNENIARLIAFELEQILEERRSNLYPYIFNLISSEVLITSDQNECLILNTMKLTSRQ